MSTTDDDIERPALFFHEASDSYVWARPSEVDIDCEDVSTNDAHRAAAFARGVEPPFEDCPLNGLVCTVCGKPQRTTWSGDTCGDHGGADGVEPPPPVIDFPTFGGDGWELINGDCLAVLKTFADASVDACVTDPPAGISFMGRTWDDPTTYGFSDGGKRTGGPPGFNLGRNPTCQNCGGRKRAGPKTKSCTCDEPAWNTRELRDRDRQAFIDFIEAVMVEVLRVLKPGGHALVWAIPRTSHWTATAIEDAGFEIRDVITHHFGSGFPKSLDVSKAIDKAAGAERAVVGQRPDAAKLNKSVQEAPGGWVTGKRDPNVTSPATDEAARWEGFGTALKPASEHWILARKPLVSTVAANVTEYGTGAINIDGCRIHSGPSNGGAISGGTALGQGSGWNAHNNHTTEIDRTMAAGRWPANLVLSHHPDCRAVGKTTIKGDARAAQQTSPGTRPGGFVDTGAESGDERPNGVLHGDAEVEVYECVEGCPVAELDRQSGGASRFFYVAKPSQRERNAGLDGERSIHPTVKALGLMRWLVRLVGCQPGSIILDPFAGSGSTLVAALLEGFAVVGIEQAPEYVEIARRRVEWWLAHPEGK